MKLSEIEINGIVNLDPGSKTLEWLGDDFRSVVLTSPVRFSVIPGTGVGGNRYRSDSGSTVWEDLQTELEIETDALGNVEALLFIRPFLDGDLNGASIHSVSDCLRFQIATLPDGTVVSQSVKRWFEAQLALGSRHITINLLPSGHDQLELDVRFDPGEGPSLGDLFKLLGYVTTGEQDVRSDLTWLPDELKTGSVLEITDFHTVLRHTSTGNEEPVTLPGLRTGGCSILNIGIGLSFLGGHSWDIIPGHDVLKVGQLTAQLDVDYPLENAYRFPRIDVGGIITISTSGHKDANIDLSARWPDYSVSATLRSGDSIPLGSLLQQLGVPAGNLKDSLLIDDLSLQAEPVLTPRSFSLSLGVSNIAEWQFDLWQGATSPTTLKFERLNVFVDYQGGDSGYLNGRLFGQLAIGGLEFSASAEASNGGWAFSGSLSSTDTVGDWLPKIGRDATGLPAALLAFKISWVELSFHTADTDLSFTLDCSTTWNQTELQARLMLHYSRQAGGKEYQFQAEGHIKVGNRQFDLVFDKAAKGGDTLLAVYSNPDHDKFDLGAALEKLSGIGVPDFDIALSSIELALNSPEKTSDKQLVMAGVDMGGSLNLANLPLVGSVLNTDHAVAMSLEVLYCSEPTAPAVPDLLARINALLPSGAEALKPPASKFTLTPTLQIGTDLKRLTLPVGIDDRANIKAPDNAGPIDKSSPATPQAGGVSWYPVQKHFGPAYVGRIGGRFNKNAQGKGGELEFLIDAALTLGPVTFSLGGLAVRTPLNQIQPEFSLQGLGLEFESGPLRVSGAFLHEDINGVDTYSGCVRLGFKAITLSAIGSYSEVQGQKSLFLYGVLNYAFGGPACFFVEGLAAGFGYNRYFVPPSISQVHEFPLITEAQKPVSLPASNTKAQNDFISGEIQKLNTAIPFRSDQYFLAAGIKFNSFKLIDSVVILTVSFGQHFEVNILGNAHLVMPTPDALSNVPALAVIDMDLAATVNPDAGIISIQAQLTPASYLFSDACRLTGGFAFFAWIGDEHKGDFVVTFGGYHPAFSVPAHYPIPPRVALNWHYSDALTIKGDMYCALTPVAIMAGGHLDISFHEGSIRAWLHLGADFLLQWKPYHYDASAHADIGGSIDVDLFFFTGTITLDLGAELHLWGPELTGTATVHLYLVSFDVHFGSASTETQPILWSGFRTSFLPATPVTIAVAEGLVVNQDNVELTVNAKDLSIVVDCAVPSKTFTVGKGNFAPFSPVTEVSVAPLEIAVSEFSSHLAITVSKDDIQDVTNKFKFEPRLKPLPTALWGDRSYLKADDPPGSGIKAKVNMSESAVTGEVLCGFMLSVLPSDAKGSFGQDGEQDLNPRTIRWAKINSRTLANVDIATDIMAAETASKRSDLMKLFGLEPGTTDIRGSIVSQFHSAPIAERAAFVQ